MLESLQANTTISHYRIVSKIGAGGMGEVYLAQDTSELGRTVALKILPAELAADQDRLHRFIQEARTVSNLNHPNILTVHEFGQAESASFMAAEYVDGVTLRQHLSQRRLKLVDVLDVAIQVVAALNAAHEAGITHRDLKPENVMVRRDHIVKVLDFGLAKPSAPPAGGQVDSEAGTKVLVQTEPGLVMGTVGYMSPEQSAGQVVDQRTDIWSVGVVLYEMIAGRLPFAGRDIHRQIIAIQEQEPAPLSRQVEGVPERLEEIVAKCLAKDKGERYQTAKDLLIDLRNLRRKLDVDAEIERTVAPQSRAASGGASGAGGQRTQTGAGATDAGQAHPTSSAEYVVTGIRRHKLAAAAALLATILGVAALGLFPRPRDAGAAIESIAVLPFENRSNDADTEYLSDGLAESLIYRLSQLPDLKVSPTSSVFRYKGKGADVRRIGDELGVNAVMTGRMVQRGDSLTISVELVDVRNNKLLWGEQYERRMSELLQTQREIAATIAQKLQLKLAGADAKGITKKYTESNEAYQLYLKGRYHFARRTKDDVLKAVEYYNQAIKLDPTFALAYARIAEAYNQMPNYPYLAPNEAIPQAKAAARRALEIDPTLSEAHAALANSLVAYDWNWAEAESGFRRALEFDPNNALAHYRYATEYLMAVGRSEEALAEVKRALEIEPLDINMVSNVARVYLYGGQPGKALEHARKAHEIDPNFVVGRFILGMAYNRNGLYEDAIRLSETSLQNEPTNQFMLQVGGYAYAKAGRRREAEEVIKKFREIGKTQYVASYFIASIHGALGDKDKAFADLNKAYEQHDSWLRWIKVDPLMDNLRDDPRFGEMLKRLNLSE